MSFPKYQLGLTGYPLEHSISPHLHRAALKASGLQGDYRLYPVSPSKREQGGLAALLDRIRSAELHGLNVTVPYKQAVIPFLDQLTPAAQSIAAVNTIYMKKGRLLGDNTDAPGFQIDLVRLFTGAPVHALVLGAGGSARAVVYALLQDDWQVTIAARRLAQAEKLAAVFNNGERHIDAIIQSRSGIYDRLSEIGLIINCTPVGMWPKINASPWPDGIALPQAAAVYDLVYNPPQTQLIAQATAAGLRTRGGLGMLVEQAALAFERWTGLNAPRDEMWDAVPGAWRKSNEMEGDL
jgi:shikimate dehydrogenase